MVTEETRCNVLVVYCRLTSMQYKPCINSTPCWPKLVKAAERWPLKESGYRKPVWRLQRYFCCSPAKLKPLREKLHTCRAAIRPASRSCKKQNPRKTSFFNRRPVWGLVLEPCQLANVSRQLADPLSCYVAFSHCLDLLELTEVAHVGQTFIPE